MIKKLSKAGRAAALISMQQREVLSIITNSLENFISHATKSVFNDYCLITAWNLQPLTPFWLLIYKP